MKSISFSQGEINQNCQFLKYALGKSALVNVIKYKFYIKLENKIIKHIINKYF